MSKKRFRNYALWTSLISQGVLVAQGLALAFGVNLTEDMVQPWVIVGNGILVILSTLGIISNPTNPNGKGYNL